METNKINNIDRDFFIIEGNDHVLSLDDRTTLKVGTFRDEIKANIKQFVLKLIDINQNLSILNNYVIHGQFTSISQTIAQNS